MSDSVDRVFVHALNTVKRIPRSGTARPPSAERLKLYGLYKQSMEGDVEGVMDRPIGNTPEVHSECEKWDAWYAQRDLSRTEAKRRYISTLIDTMHQYASHTSEARELVAELEFVWDQIKFNVSSSSSSSPLNTVGVPPLSRSAYGSIGGRLADEYERPLRDSRDSRLRVLSPVSQPEDRSDIDQEDEDEDEFEEARDSLYEQDEADNSTTTHTDVSPKHTRRPTLGSIGSSGAGLRSHSNAHSNSHSGLPGPKDGRWRRRVEQALTKMTAEIAAVREQMETRSVAQRRRNGLWAWVKWMVWVAVRQILVDIAMLGMLLIWMRIRGGSEGRRPSEDRMGCC
ncbi:hypothetical protein N7541_002101 [Penicillium brevicompactum]|uniref:ACB domain-containing protein n=1 Tax=Penicillium brevicompactum TaxID=5074 RepID=A0A9W9UXP2_PENBR|nr:hypothetical protein N7541_002101 [Penicillium brevicompactum]